MSTNTEYYAIRNKVLANAILRMSGERFYIMDSHDDPNIKLYTFKRTKAFYKALNGINQLKEACNE